MIGVTITELFRTFPYEFPHNDIVGALEQRIGRPLLGKEAASGTDIIAQLEDEHLRMGNSIVYTSADSVLQMAAHEDVVFVDVLYQWC